MQENILRSIEKTMRYRIRLTIAATQDMDSIFAYIAEESKSVSTAYSIIEKLRQAIFNLEDFPFIFSLIDEEPWKTRGFRKAIVDNYLIIYGVDDLSASVIIYKVVSSRRDIETVLFEI